MPVETYGLTHLALTVADPARSARFYQDVFGCIVSAGDGVEAIELQTPGRKDVISMERASGGEGSASVVGAVGGVSTSASGSSAPRTSTPPSTPCWPPAAPSIVGASSRPGTRSPSCAISTATRSRSGTSSRVTPMSLLGWFAEVGTALARAGAPATDPLTLLVLAAALATTAGSHGLVAVTRVADAAHGRAASGVGDRIGRRLARALDPSAHATAHRLSVIRT